MGSRSSTQMDVGGPSAGRWPERPLGEACWRESRGAAPPLANRVPRGHRPLRLMHYDPVLASLLWTDAKNNPDPNVRGEVFELLIGYFFETLMSYRPRFRLLALD